MAQKKPQAKRFWESFFQSLSEAISRIDTEWMLFTIVILLCMLAFSVLVSAFSGNVILQGAAWLTSAGTAIYLVITATLNVREPPLVGVTFAQ